LTRWRTARRRACFFSGDVGRKNLPITRDPDPAPVADYLIMESTYGDRLHAPVGDVKQKLAGIVKRVTAPRRTPSSFPPSPVERTQQLVLLLHELIDAKQISRAAHLRRQPAGGGRHRRLRETYRGWGPGSQRFAARGEDPFGWKRLRYTQTVQESKALNDLRVPYLVMSASECARLAAFCTT